MPWVYSGGSGTPPSYTWFGTNYMNQCASPLTLPSNCAVTQLKVYAAGRSSSVSTRLALWSAGSSVQVQSSTFTMSAGSESVGGQYWYTKTVTPKLISSGGTYWVGLYRNPSGGHIMGTTASGTTGYTKTNTSSFPNIYSMSGYTSDDKRMYAGVFYITAPSAVTSASVSRVSDSKQTITWTRNSSSDQPYDNIYIERWDVWHNSWYVKATLSGTATSYTDSSTTSNNNYRYRIRAKNTVGYSSYAYTGYIDTTPYSPADVECRREGTSVNVNWTDEALNEDNFEIQRRTSTDGITWTSYSTLSTSIAPNTEEYYDLSPANYNQYRVRTRAGTLYSSYEESNTVVILTPPNPPTNVIPVNYAPYTSGGSILISWTHNPIDGSTQTYYEARFRAYGSSWSYYVPKTSSSTSNFYVNPADLGIGKWEFEIRTWGACTTGGESGDGSSYYEGTGYTLGSLEIATRPEVTLVQPNGIDDYNYSVLDVIWSYSQLEGNPQSQWIVHLYDLNLDSSLLETKTATNSLTSTTMTTRLENNKEYYIEIYVADDLGLWSYSSDATFETDFYIPPTPTIEVEEGQDGTAVISITNPTPSGTEVSTEYNTLYRSIDGGITYEMVLDEIESNTIVTDYLPLLNGDTYYYVDAVSSTPTISSSAVSSITITKFGEIYINTGDNFSDSIVLFGDVSLSESIQKDTTLQHFEGRIYPVEYKSSNITQTLSFSCDLTNDKYETLKNIILSDNNIFYRDYFSRWFYCSINNASLKRKDNSAYQFSCNFIRLEAD